MYILGRTHPWLSPTTVQTASASFAALSLSSPTVSHRPVQGVQPIQVPGATSAHSAPEFEPASVDDSHLSASPPQSQSQSHIPLASSSINVAKSGRKRGTIFTCESCSKVGPFSLRPLILSHVVAWLNLTGCARPGLPTSLVFDQTPMGTYPSMAGGVQVCVE